MKNKCGLMGKFFLWSKILSYVRKKFFESFTQSQQGVTLVAWGEGLYSWQNIIDYRAPSACGE